MKAFIFDFDGVIVDSEQHWDKDALTFYRTFVPTFTAEDDKKLKGRNIHDTYNILVNEYGATMGKDEYMTLINDFAAILYREKTQLLPGIRELLNRLNNLKIPTGIASSGERPWIDEVLERMDMTGAFGPVTVAGDVGIGKPDPAVYLEAARRLGAEPSQCVAYEDSTNGLRAAHAAGMTCIAIRHSWGYDQDLSLADMIVGSHDELTDEVLRSL